MLQALLSAGFFSPIISFYAIDYLKKSIGIDEESVVLCTYISLYLSYI